MTVISDKQRKVLEQYHNETSTWGTNAGQKRVPFIKQIVAKHNAKTILDYGAGKATLTPACRKAKVSATVTPYEPGVPQYASLPKPHDIVVSFGVLEHVEPELIEEVLAHTYSLTKKVAYHEIGTLPSKHIMPDGRPAHLIVEDKHWWQAKLEEAGYRVVEVEQNWEEGGDPKIKLDPTRGKGHVMFVCVPDRSTLKL